MSEPAAKTEAPSAAPATEKASPQPAAAPAVSESKAAPPADSTASPSPAPSSEEKRAASSEEKKAEDKKAEDKKAEDKKAEDKKPDEVKAAAPEPQTIVEPSITAALGEKQGGGDESTRRLGSNRYDEGLGPDFRDSEYVAPSRDLARQNAQSLMWRRGRAPLGVAEKELAELGPGVRLYFATLRMLCWLFLAMSAVAVPALALNKAGSGVAEEDIDSLGLTLYSVGNQGLNLANVEPGECLDDGGTIDCNGTYVELWGSEVLATDVGLYLTWIDMLYSVVFCVGMVLIGVSFRKNFKRADLDHVRVSDYAVLVRGLPADVTEEEVGAHFDALYDLSKPQPSFWMVLGCLGVSREGRPTPSQEWEDQRASVEALAAKKKKKAKVRPEGEAADPQPDDLPHPPKPGAPTSGGPHPAFEGKWVADVSLARPYGAGLRWYLQQAKRLRKLRVLRARVKQAKGDTGKIAKAEARLARLEKTVEAKRPKLSDAQLHTCEAAFVTFNCAPSAMRCLEDYRASQHWWARLFQPRALRFQHRGGKRFPLRVVAAPDPSDILWENIDVHAPERRARKAVTKAVTFALLACSFLIVNEAQNAQAAFENETPTIAFCETELPAAHWGSYWSFDEAAPLVHDADATEAQCGADEFFISYEYRQWPNVTTWLPSPSAGAASTNRSLTGMCAEGCVADSDDSACETLACAVPAWEQEADGGACQTYKRNFWLGCYCLGALQDAVASDGVVTGANNVLSEQGDLCSPFIQRFLAVKTLVIVASLGVLVTNAVLLIVLKALAKWERHSSASGQAAATAYFIFFSQLLNTGVVVVLVNATLPNGMNSAGVLTGDNSGFERNWYVTVGAAISITMIMNVVAPHAAPLIKCFVRWVKMLVKRRGAVTQSQLNDLYVPEIFDISLRLPFALNSIFITMLFCSALPILLPVAALSAAVSYAVDKLMICKGFYRRPPSFDASLAQATSDLLPWALLAHLAMAVWVYGANDVLKSDPVDAAWISGGNVDANNEEEVQEAYDQFLADASDVDPFGREGIVVKIVRKNVFPVFLLFCLYAGGWLAFEIAGRRLALLAQRVVSSLSSSLCGGRALQLGLDDHWFVALRQCYLSGDFFEPCAAKKTLTKHELASGLSKVVSAEGVAGLEQLHPDGRKKKTWEALQAHGVSTFDVLDNPSYRAAVEEMTGAAAKKEELV